MFLYPQGFSRTAPADLFDLPDSTKPSAPWWSQTGSNAGRKTIGPMVEPDGIEPTTSCLQSTRSPN